MKKLKFIALLMITAGLTFLLIGCGSVVESLLNERNAQPSESSPAPTAAATSAHVHEAQPVPPAEQAEPDHRVPEEYIGHWAGRVNDISLSFNVESDGTGVYTFEQSGYTESYEFTLEVGTETFFVQIPEVNTLDIVSIEGTYVYLNEMLILEVSTSFVGGRVFEYTVPCQKVARSSEDGASPDSGGGALQPGVSLSASQLRLVGSWSISAGAFSYEDTGIGGFEGSFTVSAEGLLVSSNMFLFDSSGAFYSEYNLVDPNVMAGESLNMTRYERWSVIEDSVPANGSVLSGKLEFVPPADDGFGYELFLSPDDVLTLVITELYYVQSTTTAQGLVTMGGDVPMTYTLTLVPTPGG